MDTVTAPDTPEAPTALSPTERFQGCLLGLAVGDALGTTLECRKRGSFEPITDMIGGGPFGLRPGQWTDDTSMALCMAASLVENGGFDPRDQMNRYCRWVDDGYMSSNGHCFDVGNTVFRALTSYRASGDPYSGPTMPTSAGNGSLMRLAPVVMFFHHSVERAIELAGDSSRTTHGAVECIHACKIFAEILARALGGASRSDVLSPVSIGDVGEAMQAIADMAFFPKSRADIQSSGYVVHTLEAALWCFGRTESFRDAVLLAANLGDDADTTAAVCGQLAGAFYGVGDIPEPWLDVLTKRHEMANLAEQLRLTAG
jgi:ADP-ribosyl-[dinitrogen reductase] hydrolase